MRPAQRQARRELDGQVVAGTLWPAGCWHSAAPSNILWISPSMLRARILRATLSSRAAVDDVVESAGIAVVAGVANESPATGAGTEPGDETEEHVAATSDREAQDEHDDKHGGEARSDIGCTRLHGEVATRSLAKSPRDGSTLRKSASMSCAQSLRDGMDVVDDEARGGGAGIAVVAGVALRSPARACDGPDDDGLGDNERPPLPRPIALVSFMPMEEHAEGPAVYGMCVRTRRNVRRQVRHLFRESQLGVEHDGQQFPEPGDLGALHHEGCCAFDGAVTTVREGACNKEGTTCSDLREVANDAEQRDDAIDGEDEEQAGRQ